MKILFTIISLLLAACGFHLKGTLPHTQLPQTSWQINNAGILQSDLQTALHQAGAHTDSNSQAVLQIISIDSKKDIYTITRAAKLNEYLLSLQIRAQAFHFGKAWGEPINIRIERTLPYADSLILGKQEEEQTIWQEMYHDAAEQLVRQLSFLE